MQITTRALLASLCLGVSTFASQLHADDSSSIVFIDAAVSDWQTLAHAVRPGIETVALDPRTDELGQIADTLRGRHNLAAITVISHGAPGVIILGAQRVDENQLQRDPAFTTSVREALAPGGSLLLYGCAIAEGADGSAFISDLAKATGAAVAASTNATGDSAQGGDWTLESTTRGGHEPVIFSAASEQRYGHLLGQTVETYDADVGSFDTTASSFTLNGITYQTDQSVETGVYSYNNNPYGPPPLTSSSAPNNGVLLMNVQGASLSTVSISLSGGGVFRLQSFDLDVTAGTQISIEPDGNATNKVVYYTNGDGVETTFHIDVSSNANFSGITSVTIANVSGSGYFVPTFDNLTYTPGSPPVVTTTGGTTNYYRGASATTIDSGVTLSDSDNTTQASATISITSGFHSGDVLAFSNVSSALFGNITGSYNSGTGVLTLTSSGATASNAQWANAFDAATFASSSTSYGNRTISFAANDGTNNSAAATDTVDVLNPDPIVTTDSGSASFVAGDNTASTPVAVDSGITVTDPDSSVLSSATASISGNFQNGEDVLAFTNTNATTYGNVTASYNAATGVITLFSSGSTATLAQWQAALRAITYTDTAITPNTATRTVSFAVTDGNSNSSNTATRTVTVADTDQTPIVTTTGGTTNYVGGASAVTIDSGVTVSDGDNTAQSSATVSITGGFHSGDILAFTNTNATLYGNITGFYNAATGVLSLTSSGSTATDAQWANTLSSVTFSTGSGATSGDRTISFTINDGSKNSAAATDTVAVAAPPLVTTDSGSSTFTRSSNTSTTPVAVDLGVTVSDSGSATLQSGTVAITGNLHSSEDALAFTNDGSTMGNVSGSYNSATGVLTLTSSGGATLAQWNAALQAVTYTDTAISPNTATRTISFSVTDGNNNTSNTATRTVVVHDTAAPSVSSVTVPADATYILGQNLDFTITYDEAVTVNTGGGTPYLTLTLDTGGSVQAAFLSGSGTTTLTFRYTVISGNTDTNGITVGTSLTLNGGTIKDSAGNNAATSGLSVPSTSGVLVDGLAPTVSSIDRSNPNSATTNATSVDFAVTFSEDVSGVDTSDFTLTSTGTASGSIASISSVSASTYKVTVNSLSGSGTVRLDLKSSGTGITDTAGNAIAGGFTSGQTYTLDQTAPTVSSIVRESPSVVHTSGSSVTYRVTFSEAVSGVDTAAFTLTTVDGSAAGTIDSVSAVDSSHYDVTVSALSGLGSLRLDVKSSGTSVTDTAGNALSGGFTSGDFYLVGASNVFDSTVLSHSTYVTVSSSLDYKEAQRFTTASGAPLTLRDVAVMIGSVANSPQPVVTINADNGGSVGNVVATLTNPTTLTANALNVWTGHVALSPSTTYWVVFADTSASGSYSVDVAHASSGASGTWQTSADYAFSQYRSGSWVSPLGGYVLQLAIGATSAPSISSVSAPADGTYHDGQSLEFTVNFSDPVTVTGTPQLGFTAGSTTLSADYVSGSGTTALTFRYTVQAADADSDGISLDSSLSLNGGTIQDSSAVDAELSFTPPDTSGILLGTDAPTITSATTASGTYNSPFSYTITATSVVTISSYSASGLPSGLQLDTSTGAITGTPTQSGDFTVTLGATNSAGTGHGTLTLSVAKAAATVSLGNLSPTYDGAAHAASVTTTPSGLSTSVTYNSSSTAPTSAGSYTVAATVTDPNYTGSASGTLIIAPAEQTITFSPIGSVTVGTPVTLSATASSGLPVTFSLLSGDATVAGNTLTVHSSQSTVTVRAIQAGTNDYNAATAEQTVSQVHKLAQTITFTQPDNKATSDAAFALSATASSGLTVTYTVQSGPASVSGSTLTLTGAPGTVTVVASQAGDSTYEAAADVARSFTVTAPAPLTALGSISGGTQTAGSFAATVAKDGTSGVAIGYLPGLGGFVLTFTPDASGNFTVTTEPLTGQNQSSANAAAAPAEWTFHGQIQGNSISGSITELGYSFAANFDPVSGPTADLSGYYVTSSLDTTTDQVHTIIGTNGDVYVLAALSDQVTSTSGTVDTSGSFTLETTSGDTVTGTADATAGTLDAAILQPGGTTDFEGTRADITRTDRLINLSSRARVGTGEDVTITGFVIGGTQPKQVLLRAVGPSLARFGVSDLLADPRLRLMQGSTELASNDDWSNATNASAIADAMLRTGAFSIDAGSKDAAILVTLQPGAYTAIIDGKGQQGVALAEVYDASADPAAEYQRLINISTRGYVGSGDDTLIGGFIVTGNTPKRVLIRGIGPGLSAYGVSGVLADPKLTIYSGQTAIASNDNWGSGANTSSTLAAAATSTGAFALQAGSKDAALLITLAPGAYTVHVTSTDASTGIALLEVYELP